MKKLFTLFAIAALVCVGCSDDYDDSGLQYRVGNLESRVAKLEQLCKQMNTNISALQTIVGALQNNDYVTGVAPVTSNGENIGYTITFTKSAPITIYHGQNGKDGANGADGKDGHTSVIGVRQDTDDIYYWTLDGEWLTDNAGNKIKAEGCDGQNGSDGKDGADGQPGKDGQDGITPQLKIEGGYWFVSTDNGTTWTNLGKATGEDGKDGNSIFQSVTQDEDNIYFALANGDTITLSKYTKLSITFDCGNSLELKSGSGKYIHYTIKGGTANNLVKVELYTAIETPYKELRVTPHTADTGDILVILGSISGSTYKGSNKILVTVLNGETTIMTAINITVK